MNKYRFVCLDTETTGLRPVDGSRIIEIGMVEINSGIVTGRCYQSYLNCKEKLSDIVKNVTKITDEMLVGKPDFKDIVDDVYKFLNTDSNGNESKAILVIHNAKFDLSFLNFQLQEINRENLKHYQVIDTMEMVRNHMPGSKLSLDVLCEKYGVDLSQRQSGGHGALLDSKLLAEVFIKLVKDGANFEDLLNDQKREIIIKKRENSLQSRSFHLNNEDLERHALLLEKIKTNVYW
ncbi:exonuclease domain-containing protein [Candidatus Deianiraea vastatrix]|uniref:DNA-directed DNA polymerase n=1 Tax=Candidatus Deianiraea vastatrix TaxID=2163644 RepID=A0A5B8XEI6_9RICK|nr:exonuclease domain-containing protein [Candidatus Deianiraea vastatrix]QED23386.1 DNA polymerase III subunit epsilon [Candidatus Deianiraea vastatrix]